MPRRNREVPVSRKDRPCAHEVDQHTAYEWPQDQAGNERHLERAESIAGILLRGARRHKRQGRCEKAREAALEQPAQEKMMRVLRESHQDMGNAQTEHGPDDHGLSPDPVAQHAPEGLHAGRDQEGGGKDDTAPDFERLIPIDAEVPQVKRQEWHHHIQADAGNELGRPDAVKISSPELHSNGCVYSLQVLPGPHHPKVAADVILFTGVGDVNLAVQLWKSREI